MRGDHFGGERAEEGPIFIVRHAQSAANAGGRTTDPAAIPITDTGAAQAQCVGDLFSNRPRVIAVSRYLRTVQTGEPLLRRYPDVPVEEWRVEEFTYLDTAACAGTTYAERKGLRESYWKRCDPLWADGPGCECFADFIRRVQRLEKTLSLQDAGETIVVFTHGFVMRALLWLQQHTGPITRTEMAGFDRFRRRVSVPNCAVLRASPNGIGRLSLSTNVSVAHVPVDLRTEQTPPAAAVISLRVLGPATQRRAVSRNAVINSRASRRGCCTPQVRQRIGPVDRVARPARCENSSAWRCAVALS